ncbi:DUF2490 domain-containing protein [Mucilaginibacter jinjuensis]|uniref:DUF2490 domain-containing protein n=1 Tax=Mucilaginibacter jinjuensis TaxID=1176721 RepID=A0ABY7TEI3_9SPHI|nr:DUF2490 domain-containing protein [Mucilaginibacter jinjuensis]WCT14939.1 DUF2490 domain-containing protein [Mucilaginibacter jinjuensis]
MPLKIIARFIDGLKFVRPIIYTLVLLSISFHASAQSSTFQLWTDFTQNLRLNKGYTLDNEISYRTIFGNDTKWRSLNLTPKITKSLGDHWDIMFYMGFIATRQEADYNTRELRPGIGAKYYLKPTQRLTLGLLTRLESREEYTTEVSTWKESMRSRFRLEQNYLFNRKSMADNHVWYGLADQEFYLTLGKSVQEKYSNQVMIRVGVGYKPNNHWRYEAVNAYQFSRNTIDGEFGYANNQILRLRCRYYFN